MTAIHCKKNITKALLFFVLKLKQTLRAKIKTHRKQKFKKAEEWKT